MGKAQGGSANMSGYVPGVAAPGTSLSLFRAAFDDVLPRTLMLGTQRSRTFGSSFPPAELDSQPAGYSCGLLNESGGLGVLTQMAACYLTYGAGPVQLKAVFDWRGGCYNLPPCSYVEVGVMLWGSGWVPSQLAAFQFVASVCDGSYDGAIVPTVSDVRTAGVAPQIFAAPFQSAAIDIELIGSGQVSLLGLTTTSSGSPFLYRDDETVTCFPPWGPVGIAPSSRHSLTALAPSTVLLRYYLSL